MAFCRSSSFCRELASAPPNNSMNGAVRGASLLKAVRRKRCSRSLPRVCLTEEGFLQRLAQALNWPYLDLPKVTVPAEARNRISTKVAFQYSILPTLVSDGSLQVAVSNPFDTAMLNAVRFDARVLSNLRWPQAGNREGAEKILRRRRRNARGDGEAR